MANWTVSPRDHSNYPLTDAQKKCCIKRGTNDMNEGSGRMTIPWLTQIIRKVTRGRWRVVAACLVTDADIQQDLFVDAFGDPVFAKELNAFATDVEAAAFACTYLNRAWHRRKKGYLGQWQRLR